MWLRKQEGAQRPSEGCSPETGALALDRVSMSKTTRDHDLAQPQGLTWRIQEKSRKAKEAWVTLTPGRCSRNWLNQNALWLESRAKGRHRLGL